MATLETVADPFTSCAPAASAVQPSSPIKVASSKGTALPEQIPALINQLASPNRKEQRDAAVKLLKLSCNNEGNCRQLLDAGGPVLIATTRDTKDNEAREALFGCLWNIALHQVFRQRVHELQGGNIALEALHNLDKNTPKLYVNVCGLLRALATETPLQSELAGLNAVQLLAAVVTLCGSSSKDVAREGIAALGNLACDKTNLGLCRQHGMGQALRIVLKEHMNIEATAQAAFSAMWQYTIDEGNQGDMGSKDGIELCLQGMEKHKGKTALLKNACGALRAITCQPENQAILAKLDGCGKLVRFIQREMEHAESVRQAVAAFWNLAKEESKQIELAKKGGIDVILEVIRKHQMDPETQALACGAIRALAVAQTNKLSVAMKGGVQTLTTSLRINLPHIHVFRQVVAALWNLALHSDLQLRIGKVGTISLAPSLILEAMWLHAGPQTTLEGIEALKFACGTLRALGANAENRAILLDLNCHEPILAVMQRNPDPGILEQGAAALWNMSVIDDAKVLFREGGIKQFLVDLKLQATHIKVQEMIAGALKSIA